MQQDESKEPLSVAQARWRQLHDNVYKLSSSSLAIPEQRTSLLNEINDFMAVYSEAEKISVDGHPVWIEFFTRLMQVKEAAIHSYFAAQPSQQLDAELRTAIQDFHSSAVALLEMNQLNQPMDEKLAQVEARAKSLDKEKADGGVKVDELQNKALQLRQKCNAFREDFKDPTKYKAQGLTETLKAVREKALLAEIDAFTNELNQVSVIMHLGGIDEESLAEICEKLSAFLNDERIPKSPTFELIAQMLELKLTYSQRVDAIMEYFKAQAARYRHMFAVKLNSESSFELVRLLMDINQANADSIAQQIERMQINWVKKLR